MESKNIGNLIQPKIVNHEAFNIAGILVHGDPKNIDYDEVWSEANLYYDHLLRFTTDKAFYNVYFETNDGMVDLIAGMSVKNSRWISEDLKIHQVPAGCYAMFGCFADALDLFYGYINDKWFPSSKYEYDDRPSFEYFPPGTMKAYYVSIYIPIKEKKMKGVFLCKTCYS